MLSAERERLILEYLQEQRGLVSFQDLEALLQASAATIRRDLTRLSEAGLISRLADARQRRREAHHRPRLSCSPLLESDRKRS